MVRTIDGGGGPPTAETATSAVLLLVPPTVTTSGKSPEVRAGTRSSICSSPTPPGARPANRTSADSPPSVAVSGWTGVATGAPGDCAPVATGGSTGPCPVMYTVIQPPASTGWSVALRAELSLNAKARFWL